MRITATVLSSATTVGRFTGTMSHATGRSSRRTGIGRIRRFVPSARSLRRDIVPTTDTTKGASTLTTVADLLTKGANTIPEAAGLLMTVASLRTKGATLPAKSAPRIISAPTGARHGVIVCRARHASSGAAMVRMAAASRAPIASPMLLRRL